MSRLASACSPTLLFLMFLPLPFTRFTTSREAKGVDSACVVVARHGQGAHQRRATGRLFRKGPQSVSGERQTPKKSAHGMVQYGTVQSKPVPVPCQHVKRQMESKDERCLNKGLLIFCRLLGNGGCLAKRSLAVK